jgi:hypothetical protein
LEIVEPLMQAIMKAFMMCCDFWCGSSAPSSVKLDSIVISATLNSNMSAMDCFVVELGVDVNEAAYLALKTG